MKYQQQKHIHFFFLIFTLALVLASLDFTYLAVTWLVTINPNTAVNANVKYQTKPDWLANQFELTPKLSEVHAKTNRNVPDVAW